jgi:hypothetical protein
MQAAHSTSNCAGLPFGSVVPVPDGEVVAVPGLEVVAAPVCAALDVVEVVELRADATLGGVELPPHPATRAPLTSAAAVSARARGDRGSRPGGILTCI